MSEKGKNHKESKIKKQLHLWVNSITPWKSSFSQTKWLVKIGWSHGEEFQILPRGQTLVDLDFLAYAQREFYPRTEKLFFWAAKLTYLNQT